MNAITNVTACEIMRQPVVCTDPDQKLEDLEQRLLEGHLSGMPVLEGGRLVGFIAKTDLVRLAVVQDALDGYVQERLPWIGLSEETAAKAAAPTSQSLKPIKHLKVRDTMRREVVTCSPETPVSEIAQKMVDREIHRVLVVEADQVLGIVSTLDLARLLADN